MQSVVTLLVFQNHPMVALEIYKCLPLPSFGPKDDKGLHGRSLVRDCVKASVVCFEVSKVLNKKEIKKISSQIIVSSPVIFF